MAEAIRLNANALVSKLDLFSEVQLPYVSSLALNRSLTPIKEALKHEMRDSFRNPVPFTLNSLRTKASNKQNLRAELYISFDGPKGNAPEDYLLPQITGGPVYRTRFQRRLQAVGMIPSGAYMIPDARSSAANLNQYGRVRASQYVQALYGIRAMNDIIARSHFMGVYGGGKKIPYRTADSYIYVPYRPEGVNGGSGTLATKIRQLNKGRLPGPGIYKVGKGGNGLTLVFRQLRSTPVVEKRFDFRYAAGLAAEREFATAFATTFKEVTGKAI